MMDLFTKSLPATAIALILPFAATAEAPYADYHSEAFVQPSAASADFDAMADASPHLEATVNAEGETDGMVMLSDVLFDFGAATLSPKAVETLALIAKDLGKAGALEITGHTDHIGAEKDNLELAQRRAEAVRTWLITEGGVDPTALTARGIGEGQPIAANLLEDGSDNPDGRAKNRRVEFHMPKVEKDSEQAGLEPALKANRAS